jgi:hypothetical protein
VADTYSICGVCAVLDMYRLLAMRRRYMRIVVEAGTTYVAAVCVRVGYETCVAAVKLVACCKTLIIVQLRGRAAMYCTCEICIDISCALYYFSLERLISI